MFSFFKNFFISKIKNKNIVYASFNNNGFANFVPSKSTVPEWYKAIDRYDASHNPSYASTYQPSVKACMPFIEAMTSGYMITTSQDLVISQTQVGPSITWAGKIEPLQMRRSKSPIPAPSGYSPVEFVWLFPVALKIPKNHSFLITQPFNRHDTPFLTLTGIIDGPFLMYANGRVPFFVKNDFEGIIPQGTPIMQVIPFKHDNWTSKLDNDLRIESDMFHAQSNSVLEGWYKKLFWVKKKYH